MNAPGYEQLKVSLLKFVSERRAVDKVPWVKPPPLIVALRRGQANAPHLGFIARSYWGDGAEHFVLDIYGDGTFRVSHQMHHGRPLVGFGIAEIVDGKLRLQYAESGSRSEGHPMMQPILAQVDALIKKGGLP